MQPPYEDAVVVITGASTGLGRAIAVGAAEQGAKAVVINYASSDAEAEITAGQVREAGAEAVLAQGDVGEDGHCRRIAAAAEPFGRIDALFSNAGIPGSAFQGDLETIDADEFLKVYRVNVVGAFQMVRAARPLLEGSARAAVVLSSSVSGISGVSSSLTYAASKGALNTMTKTLARTVAPRIRVNALCPGLIDTPWFDKLTPMGGSDALRAHIESVTPLQAVSTAEDIAGAALFLGSTAARHMTGEMLIVDAGLNLGK
jgi:3-oxoacyl-[acyl-carrier protein] reductase